MGQEEYLVVTLRPGKPNAWQAELNRLAQEGWGLVNVIALAAGMYVPGKGTVEAVAFLRRPTAD